MTFARPISALLALTALLPIPLAAQDAIDDRISLLLAEMTPEEKVGQMTQLTLGAVSSGEATAADPEGHALDPEKLRHAIVEKHIGSILNVHKLAFRAEYWQQLITEIQDLATKETERKIPLLYGIDSVHGANYIREATLFPQNLSLAATWNPELVEKCHEICARETRAVGIPWNFAPVLDVGRQPLWSRFFETYGEDVLLASKMGTAAVRGLQGDDIAANDKVAATGKHFLAYSYPLSGHDRTQTIVPERYMREYFLPPFLTAIEEGNLASIMVNSSEINGLPVHANYSILNKLLRGQMRFNGVVLTDWADVQKLHEFHRVAPTLKEAVRMAVDAGVDMCMAPDNFDFPDFLLELVAEGSIGEEIIDQSVRRILRLKFDLGIMDDPYPQAERLPFVGSRDGRDLSLQAAKESLVLLKNDNTLPLAKDTKIFLTGPGCNSVSALHGSWTYTWQGDDEATYPRRLQTILQVFEEAHGKDKVSYAPGVTWEGTADYERAMRAAQNADVIVCVLAEKPSTETPGNIDDLALPAAQRKLVHELAFGKPIVLVLLENRPRLITDIDGLANSVIFAGYPGPYGGNALYEMLTGAMNPSGKLPFTYSKFAHNILPYDHKFSDTVDIKGGNEGFQPLYEFGHGLSYTTFQYANLNLPPVELAQDENLTISVEVTNTGKIAGDETVQVYIRDLYASITPPMKRLRAFRKVTLAPGETQTVAFDIPVPDLAFFGPRNLPIVEAGEFEVQVGDQLGTVIVK